LLHEIRDLGELIGAKYDNTNLVALVEKQFGTRTLDDLLPRHVLIPSFDLDKPPKGDVPRMWNPKFFHNFKSAGSDGAQKIADVALRTSAAPTYFPVYQGYVDGGVAANNPAMSAVAQALDGDTGKQALGDIRVFSVGTGLSPFIVSGLDNNWGLAQWAHLLASMMIEGMMGVADFECSRLLGKNYFRLAPKLPEPIALDAAGKIDELIALAQEVDLAPATSWLAANFR
jgi:patatin-like phospholipase/acyl hydrolase